MRGRGTREPSVPAIALVHKRVGRIQLAAIGVAAHLKMWARGLI